LPDKTQPRALKKVLIITYYWPPSGGAGVQRWLKFTKYLRRFGWEPIIYTADSPEYPIIDLSLEKDIPKDMTILKQAIWEPYQLYKKLIGQKKDERVVSGFLQEKGRRDWAQKLSLWLRGNVFIPDARRFWISPSIKYLVRWIKENSVDAIVTTGPPHSMHLIGKGLKQKTGIPWLADFRDPWANIDFAGDLNMTAYAKRKNLSLEKSVLDIADAVVVVSDLMAEEFRSKTKTPVTVITNGFDPDDFSVPDNLLKKTGDFSIVHTGSINNRRNHPALWGALAELVEESAEFASLLKIRLIGKNDVSVEDDIQRYKLQKYTEYIDYLPHDLIIAEQKSATVLLLTINNFGDEESGSFSPKATLTGKLFEYLAAGRPILMIGPKESQAADVIKECNAGAVAGFEDGKSIKQLILDWFLRFQKSELPDMTGNVSGFSRLELTSKIGEMLKEIAK